MSPLRTSVFAGSTRKKLSRGLLIAIGRVKSGVRLGMNKCLVFRCIWFRIYSNAPGSRLGRVI